jgi:pimeloyl-ACP methyl ester carboxylesterase
LFAFPYDWRESNFASAKKLEDFVDTIPRLRSGNFNIVAHSMGGLVAAIFITESRYGGRVNRLATLGTPFQGSLDALRILKEGDFSLVGPLLGGRRIVREVATTFPSIYELLPLFRTCCFSGSSAAPAASEFVLLRPESWEGFPLTDRRLLAGGLAARERLAQAVSKLVEGRAPKLTLIAGLGTNTDRRVYLHLQDATDAEWRSDNQGDGRVWVGSATAGAPEDAHVSLLGHANLFKDDHVKKTLELAFSRKSIPYSGTQPDELLVGTKTVRLSEVSLALRSHYAVVGKPFPFELTIRDDHGQPVRGLLGVDAPDGKIPPVLALEWAREGAAGQALVVVEQENGIYVGVLTGLNALGSYSIRARLRGIGVFEEGITVVEPLAGIANALSH